MNQPLSAIPAPADQPSADRDASTPAARLLASVRALGPGRLLVLCATALALLAFFAYLILRAIEPPYTLLFGSLEIDDSAQIVSRLDALGTTNLIAHVNLRRALEGELARTIAALADVRSARVHLVLPRHELFRRDQIEPSASITLRMYGAGRLSRRQVLAVQHLVAAAVPGLSPERITPVDDQGTLLARGGDGAEGALPSPAEEHREAYEDRLKRTVEHLLERSLGPGRVHAEVGAELDFDRVTLTEETFDPVPFGVEDPQILRIHLREPGADPERDPRLGREPGDAPQRAVFEVELSHLGRWLPDLLQPAGRDVVV